MDIQKVDMFMMTNAKYFESHQMQTIRTMLLEADEQKWAYITSIQFKDPTTMLIISLIGGGLGIDRFMIGDTGLGIGKLLTCGGLYVWMIVDWFLIQSATRQKNLEKMLMYI